jgi:class 3 adenylate cyclase
MSKEEESKPKNEPLLDVQKETAPASETLDGSKLPPSQKGKLYYSLPEGLPKPFPLSQVVDSPYLTAAMAASGTISPSVVSPSSFASWSPEDWGAPVASWDPWIGKIGQGLIHSIQRDATILELESNLTDSKRTVADLQDKYIKKVEEAQSKGEAYDEAVKANAELVQQLKQAEIELLKEKSRVDIAKNVEAAALAFAETDEAFYKLFESRSVKAFILSIDVRKSTTLMLKARDPQLFAMFIEKLCDGLRAAVLANHGVFDKFTGDGILAFFPDFYTGDDSGYWAVQTASQCHKIFDECYSAHRNCFASVLSDVGLGIGIDFGVVRLVSSWGGMTVVGAPVVYACRMGAAPAGKTFLNQPAYEQVLEKYSAYCTLHEDSIEVKGEGKTVAYAVELGAKVHNPAAPDWGKSVKEHSAVHPPS